ncbi:TetR/AcrR family transcriptional regulator [Novosphingobium sp. BL-52-GroH]|uniref:TetR/AcrR family transcriptional regulator n=1 Tax=Novosphingobium sp. BL-52-GroH TaxID=3349877 RepID=UPI00384B5696
MPTTAKVPRRKPAKPGTVAAPSSRLAGRPAAGGGDAVGAATLVDAVCDLLRTVSPDRITRAAVARHAGVNPALINYHFKDQSSLLRAAARGLLARFQDEVARPLARIESAEERLRARIEGFLRFQIAYPFFHRLVTEEVLSAQTPEAGELLAEMSRRGVADYRAILLAGEDAGTMRHVDPVLLYLTIVGMVEQAAIGRPILMAAGHPLATADEYAKRFADFISDLLLGGLRSDGTQRSGE